MLIVPTLLDFPLYCHFAYPECLLAVALVRVLFYLTTFT